MRAALLLCSLLALSLAPPALADVPVLDDRHLAVEADGSIRRGLAPISTERLVKLLEASHAADDLVAKAQDREVEWTRDLAIAVGGLATLVGVVYPVMLGPGYPIQPSAGNVLAVLGVVGTGAMCYGGLAMVVHRGQPLLTPEETLAAVTAYNRQLDGGH